MEKGTHGYIDHKRSRLIMSAVLNVVLVVSLFAIGLILTKTKSNYYTVMAVLMTVPLSDGVALSAASFTAGLFCHRTGSHWLI